MRNHIVYEIYDPTFGDHKMCKCGLEYHRHFDPETSGRWSELLRLREHYCEEFEERGIANV